MSGDKSTWLMKNVRPLNVLDQVIVVFDC